MGILTAVAFLAMSQTARPILELWPTGNPGGWTRTDKEVSEEDKAAKFLRVSGVSKPTLEFFRSLNAKPGAPTVLIFPGGGYSILAIQHEGWDIAQRLNENGIHAAVLKYRIPNREVDKPLHAAPLQDAQRAMRLLRTKGGEWGITPNRVGIMGFSAGGHLAAVASNSPEPTYPKIDAADDASIRPDFTLLVYAAYLNEEGTANLKKEIPVGKNSPPAFLILTADDWIPFESSASYALALKNASVPVEMHVYPKGGHGYGLRSAEKGLQDWPNLMLDWIRRLNP